MSTQGTISHRLRSVSCGMLGVVLTIILGDPVSSAGAAESTTTQPAVQAPAGPLPGPKYAPIRADDDFSYLDGPEGSYEPDFFDPMKRIHLSEDLILRLGGEIRGRMEAWTHQRFGAEDPTQDTFFLHRYTYHADFQYRDLARVYVEGINAFADGIDGSIVPLPEDHWDVQQLFLDFRVLGEDIPLTFRGGRQHLLYGKQRLVSPLGWANVQRTWDGLKLFWHDETWRVDAWWARPVRIYDKSLDENVSDIDFYGLYATCLAIANHGIDTYFMALRNRGDVKSANLTDPDSTGDMSLYTLGARFWGKTPLDGDTWDYDTEFAGQWGKRDGATIQAWMWTVDTGYTFEDYAWKPRLGLGADFASGDDDPYDNMHGTFNQLNPLGHAYFGFLDRIGRQNLWAGNLNVSAKPYRSLTARAAWHIFCLNKDRDAYYNVAGQPVRRDPTGDLGNNLGQELDLTLLWKVGPHASLLFGYSHMWTGTYLRSTGPSEDPDLFYVMYRFQF